MAATIQVLWRTSTTHHYKLKTFPLLKRQGTHYYLFFFFFLNMYCCWTSVKVKCFRDSIQEQWNLLNFEELHYFPASTGDFFQQALRKYAELWKFSQGTSAWTTSLKKPALKSHCVNLFLRVVLIETTDPIVAPPEQLSSTKCCTSASISKPGICVMDEVCWDG